MKVKPWQIAVIVIGILVGVGSSIWTIVASRGPDVRYDFILVDVETGDYYEVPDFRDLRKVLPMERPGGSEITLVPANRTADGSLVLTENGVRMLNVVTVKPQVIDEQTGKVTKLGQKKELSR